MTKLAIFEHTSGRYEIRQHVDEQGELLWCASDVCKALDHSNPSQALKDNVDPEDLSRAYTLTAGGKQLANFVNEAGLYSLILSSRLERAKDFKRWVTHEVLPSIRKTGSYSVTEGPRFSQTEDLFLSALIKECATISSKRLQVDHYHAMSTAYKAAQKPNTALQAPVQPAPQQYFKPSRVAELLDMSTTGVSRWITKLGYRNDEGVWDPTSLSLGYIKLYTDPRYPGEERYLVSSAVLNVIQTQVDRVVERLQDSTKKNLS